MTGETANDPRVALRADSAGDLDDVVVRDVEMFRAEVVSEDVLWLCCYLPGTRVEGDRIAFEVTADAGRLHFRVIERPEGQVLLE